MNKTRNVALTSLLTLCSSLFVLASCNNKSDVPAKQFSSLSSLQKGFTLNGELKVNLSYFTDSNYLLPDSNIASNVVTYKFDLTYQNNNDYVGLDRRYYEVKNNVDSYLFGDNAFNKDGYAYLRYLEFDNTVQEMAAYDDDGLNIYPYGVNELINPFLLMNSNDFTSIDKEGTSFNLSRNKASLMFSTFFSLLEEVEKDVTFNSCSFTEDLVSKKVNASITSNPFESGSSIRYPLENDPYHQTYVRKEYSANLEFTNLEVANAKDLIKVEPNKTENNVLGNALRNMTDAPITIRRHLTPNIEGNDQEECVDLYFLGDSIYMQVYNGYDYKDSQVKYPTTPSSSDLYLAPINNSQALYAYTYNPTSGTFVRDSANYGSIDGVFTYDDLTVDFGFINQNVFNYDSELNCFTPTIDNLIYANQYLFPILSNTVTGILNGNTTSFNIFTTDNSDDSLDTLDRIETTYDTGNSSGTVIYSYEDVGNSKLPFVINFGD